MIEVIETSEGVEVSEVGDVTVIEVGISGPQGPPGTLIEVAEDDVVIVTPLRELDFGTGFDVTTPAPRVAQIALDLAELAAGGELAGTLDAPTIDATHSGSTHQSVLDEINAHEIDVVAAHEGSAIAFTPGHGLVSADVQSAVEELADEVGAGHPDLVAHDALGLATDAELATHAATSHGTAHPDLSTHDALGLATDAELATHAATSHGTAHPDLTAHDALGLATDSELSTHAADTTAIHGITDTSALETTTGSQGKVDTHTGDTSDAHDASAISVDSTTLVGTGTDVQAVLEELDDAIAAGSGAPTAADYLVGTAQGGLSAEIVVGTSPGGELGGTWASPTVDATHSGSTHAATQAAAEATAAGADAAHVAASDPHTGYLKESNTIDFLVGTATADLGGEIVVGTTPGGELGNTWASPTVDASHSGSTHAATQAAAEATAASADSTHAAAADPHTGYVLESLLDAKGDLITASADNTPAKLTVGADDTILMADSAAGGGLKWVASATPSTQAFGDAAAAGTGDTFTRGDHKHAMPSERTASSSTPAAVGTAAVGTGTTDARDDHVHAASGDTPSTQAFGDAAAAGSSAKAAQSDHKHAMPSERVAASTTPAAVGTGAVGTGTTDARSDHVHATGAGTPAAVSTANATGSGPAAAMTDHVHAHETAHTSHDTIWDAKGDIVAGTGADAASKLTVGSDNQVLTADSTQSTGLKWAAAGAGAVATDTIWDAKGDLAAGTGADAAAKLTVGADDTILMADAAASTGLKWVASASPSAVGTAAATGTADTFTRGDHVHAHETAHTSHDTIWDAAGDLVQGSGADTAAKLARGTSLTDRLIVNGTSLAWVPHIVTITSTAATVNNSTTLVNATGLSWAIAANEKWFFQAFLLVSGASATADHLLGWTVPASCTMAWGGLSGATSNIAAFGVPAVANTAAAVLGAAGTQGVAGRSGQSGVALAGMVINSSTAGTVQLQYAQNTATAENNTVDANSTIIIWRLA